MRQCQLLERATLLALQALRTPIEDKVALRAERLAWSSTTNMIGASYSSSEADGPV